MGLKDEQVQGAGGGINNENSCDSIIVQKLETLRTSDCSSDSDVGLLVCRVCHCAESDLRGDAALGFLNIVPPSQGVSEINRDGDLTCKASEKVEEDDSTAKTCKRESGFIEFVSPEGEVFVCSTDLESGSYNGEDTLIHLGCSCKNDLALAHYACALKWFINHRSSTCEICGIVAKNVRVADIKKIMTSLKDYESLTERTATGELTPVHLETNTVVDSDALAAIRRQRLSEVSSWFNPRNNSVEVSQESLDPLSNIPTETVIAVENPVPKWAVEGTGILVATGLLTVTLAWLIAPHVGKSIAKNGLHILLGGICALTAVIFLRFVVLSKIKYGPARYWAILFVFWFLVFGIWASRTHGARST